MKARSQKAKLLVALASVLFLGLSKAQAEWTTWYIHDTGVHGWGQTPPSTQDVWEWMDATAPKGTGTWHDLDRNYWFIACTPSMSADLSGYSFSADLWLANNYSQPETVFVALHKSTWGFVPASLVQGVPIAQAYATVNNPLTSPKKYTFKLGSVDDLVLTNESLLLVILYTKPAGNTHIYYDDRSYPSSFAASPSGADTDGDGIPDIEDNCPTIPNILQEDSDRDPDIVGLWHFNEGQGSMVYDIISKSYAGVTGAAWTKGRSRWALDFHGGGQFEEGDRVVVPHSKSLDLTGPFTVEAWIKARGTDQYLAIVDKYSGGEGAPSNGFSLYLTGGNLRLTVYNAPSSCGAMGVKDLRDDQWHHVAGVCDGTNVIVYVDGVQDGISACTSTAGSSSADLGIGLRLGGWGGFMPFLGAIDDVKISKVARSPSEIAYEYNANAYSPDIIAGLWHFNEGSGSAVLDAITKSPATITGAAWTAGRFQSGLEFHGGGQFRMGDRVVVPHSGSLDLTGPFTVEAWIKARGSDQYLAIVDKYSGGQGAPSNGFSFYLTGGVPRLTVYNDPSSCGAMGATNVQDDQWHYVAGVCDGTNVIVYVDGVQDGIAACTSTPASTTADLAIGVRLSGWGGYMPFLGVIDDPKISRVALSPSEIASYFNYNGEHASGDNVGDACDGAGGFQIPVDSNQDGTLDMSDGIHLLQYLFVGNTKMVPCGDRTADHASVHALLNFNGDGGVDLSDAIAVFMYLFMGSKPPVLGTRCFPIWECLDGPTCP